MLQLANKPLPRIDWSQLYLTAEATQEPFTDVRIVTVAGKRAELLDEMLTTGSSIGPKPTTHKVNISAVIPESVSIAPNGAIDVVIDATAVNEDVVWDALDMVADALVVLDGKPGTVQFNAVTPS